MNRWEKMNKEQNSKMGESKKKIIGIDLGTTNSAIATLEAGVPVIIPNSEGTRTTPSVVAFSSTGEILIGKIAKRQGIINPENTFYSIKRLIGKKFKDIDLELNRISYKIKEGINESIKVYSPNLGKEFSPEEISSLILKKLISDANCYFNEIINQAVITVPAYFNESERLATKNSGVIAGLDVLRILNEPTAAALAYGLAKKKNEIILIFDLGGGTFDVSILEIGEDIFEVLATSGDTHLGGDNFDQAIASYILSDFKEKENIDLVNDKQALQRIIEAAEKAKIELSTLEITHINLPFICIFNNIPKHIDLEITKVKFESLIANIIDKCIKPVKLALEDSKLSILNIDKVILVGGSTRMPAVRNVLIELFKKKPNESINPDEVVAMGAAVQAGIIAGEITDLILLDVTPMSLGVEIEGGLMATIIKRNSSIPVKHTEVFSTSIDNQSKVEIHVLQGDNLSAKLNKSLGIFTLENIPLGPKGSIKIEVSFQLNADGLLSVQAIEKFSGGFKEIKISSVLDAI